MDAVTKKMGISMDTSFLSGANATFIAEMHRSWTDNPASVDSNGLIGFLVLEHFLMMWKLCLTGGQARPK